MVFVKLICKKKQVNKLVEFTEFVEYKLMILNAGYSLIFDLCLGIIPGFI